MSAYELQKIHDAIANINSRLDNLCGFVDNINARLSALEDTKIPNMEQTIESNHVKATEGMHASLLAMTRASTEAMKSSLIRDFRAIANDAVYKHQDNMH